VRPRSPAHAALGQSIRALRQERGLTQEELGLESGLDRSFVGGIERGDGNPSYESLLRIAGALEAPVSAIVAGGERIKVAVRRTDRLDAVGRGIPPGRADSR
jgi:transcriptional regulator with XRE-family HTH domain